MLSHESGENSAKQALLRHAQTTAVAAEMGCFEGWSVLLLALHFGSRGNLRSSTVSLTLGGSDGVLLSIWWEVSLNGSEKVAE
jgi:hypothetical protein